MLKQSAAARRRRVLAAERRLVLTRALHQPPTTLSERLAQLRQQAEACRAQAIILNAKLAMLERDRSDVRAMREQLVESSAKLDHAVEDITTACERRPRASLRP